MSQKITIPIPAYFLHFVGEMTISKGRNKFCIYSLIQFLRCLRMSRTVLIVYVTLCLKPPIHCLWFYCSYLTQNFELVNPFHNFFYHIGIFKFLSTNCPSKVLVVFICDLNCGSRKYIICSLLCIWLNHNPCFC